MPHEMATGLGDFECAGFRVAGARGLASTENQGSICRRWGRERRSCADAGEPYSGDRPGRRARSGLKLIAGLNAEIPFAEVDEQPAGAVA